MCQQRTIRLSQMSGYPAASAPPPAFRSRAIHVAGLGQVGDWPRQRSPSHRAVPRHGPYERFLNSPSWFPLKLHGGRRGDEAEQWAHRSHPLGRWWLHPSTCQSELWPNCAPWRSDARIGKEDASKLTMRWHCPRMQEAEVSNVIDFPGKREWLAITLAVLIGRLRHHPAL